MIFMYKKYVGDLYNVDTKEHIVVDMCRCKGAGRNNYFGRELLVKAELGLSEKASE